MRPLSAHSRTPTPLLHENLNLWEHTHLAKAPQVALASEWRSSYQLQPNNTSLEAAVRKSLIKFKRLQLYLLV
jgi:hypothetical protein